MNRYESEESVTLRKAMNNIHEMQARFQRATALAEMICVSAQCVIGNLKIAYPKKRIFLKIDRRPLKRIQKAKAKMNSILGPIITASQIQMELSKPIPKQPIQTDSTATVNLKFEDMPLSEEQKNRLREIGREDIIKHYEIKQAGYLGCLSNGNLVDRREHPRGNSGSRK